MFDIRLGDALSVLKTMPNGVVDTCITSPPYFGLRDYKIVEQIGLEKSPTEYVEKIVQIFREIRRVLKDNGTVWINLGDSYASNGGAAKGGHDGGILRDRAQRSGTYCRARYAGVDGLKSKDLIGIPWRVAFALQADGWYLRQDIIWHKPNPMPEPVVNRCVKSHEYIFLLSKSSNYFFDYQMIQEPAIYAPGKTKEKERKQGYYDGKWSRPKDGQRNDGSFKAIRNFRNKRSVWTVPTKGFKGQHFATFPPDLIRPCILAGSPPGGIVLDPFLGSGTTALVAWENGRQTIGIELNPEYYLIALDRINQTCVI